MSILKSLYIKIELILILFILLTINSLTIYAQKLAFTEHQFANELEAIEIPNNFKKYSIVVLEDKVNANVDVPGIVNRYIRFKILNKSGVENFKYFIMPQSFDVAKSIFSIPRYIDAAKRFPIIEIDDIKVFDMRIIKPDGRKINIEPIDSLVQFNFKIQHVTYKRFKVYFKIPPLEVDDELEVYYKCDLYGNRIFFNNEYPKVKFDLKIRNVSNYYKILPYNQSFKTDSSEEKIGNDIYYIYSFKANNLLPVGNKWNSKLYENCAYISFYRSNKLPVYNSKKTLIGYREYDWRFGLKSFTGFKREYNHFDYTDVNTTAYNNLHKHIFNTSPDTSIYSQIKTFNEYINNEFDYLYDLELITGDDMRLLNIGKNLNKKILRRFGTDNVYIEILDRINVDYYLMIMTDNRVSNINYNKYSDDYISPGMLAFQYKNGIYFLTVKSHRFGHHLNEVPFYYENTNMILVPRTVQLDKYSGLREKYLPNLIYYKIPPSTESENQRVYNILSNVNLDSSSTTFNCKLKLSGQFSTLIRGNYIYEYVDSIVHGDYYRKIYNISSNSKLLDKSKTYESDIFPFNANFNFKYSDNTIIKKTNDSLVVLKLENLFQHVIEKEIDTLVSNDFYFDFKQSDIFRYNLKFNQKVKLQNSEIQDIQTFTFGKYNFSIRQISENDILIESSLIIDNEKVNNNDLMQIVSLNNKITEIDKMVLNIKILNQ